MICRPRSTPSGPTSGPWWVVQDDVEAGALVRLPLGPTDLRILIYAVLVLGRRATRRTRAFVDALGSRRGWLGA